jgi:hypothetical protein
MIFFPFDRDFRPSYLQGEAAKRLFQKYRNRPKQAENEG